MPVRTGKCGQQLILKGPNPLTQSANGGSERGSPRMESHSHSEANPGTETLGKKVEVQPSPHSSHPLPPLPARRWQGGAAPLRKQMLVREAPAGEGERPVARGNSLPSNGLPLCKLWACNRGRGFLPWVLPYSPVHSSSVSPH